MDAERTYDRCLAEGSVVIKEAVDFNKAKSILLSVENEILVAKGIKKLEINTETHLFKTYYDVLRELISAFLIFDKVEISNHICLFSYIVVKHPELELDWEILDDMRQLRNRICYYGKELSREDWKSYNLKFSVYISTIKRLVEGRINDS